MDLHHSKHYQTYVNGLNGTLDQLAEARDKGEFGAIVGLEKALAFNLGGHINHSIFWNNLSPDGGGKPTGELAEHFGSFRAVPGPLHRDRHHEAGLRLAILAWDPLGRKLLIVAFRPAGERARRTRPRRHARHVGARLLPAVQEREEPDNVKAWWKVVNWADAGARIDAARTKDAGLIVAS